MSAEASVNRVCNFSAGPSVLPEEVLRKCQSDLLSFEGCGQSVMEMSHRSKQFMKIWNEAEAELRAVAAVPDNYRVFMLQGGATMQFSAIPLNFNLEERNVPAQYIVTGGWSDKAYKEAVKYNKNTQCLFTSMKDSPACCTAPNFDELKVNDEAPYVYVCVNETVHGVTIRQLPQTQKCPIVADYSSCFLSEPIPWKQYNFGIIYAGAQKNIGPAGLTVVIVRDDLIGHANAKCPVLLDYATWKKKPMYNTPPCWSVYVMGLVMKWLQNTVGGLDKMKQVNEGKAKLIYDVMDEADNNGFYSCPVSKPIRSIMNVRFTIRGDEELAKKFVKAAEERNMFNLKGHRSLGGCRASIYNAQTMETCQKLVKFMREFRTQNQ
eukprot:CAMPEP_0202690612 /NCGR_PEP_ID=MMETSP1385-20130828/5553_1 /ASSEMBLY_ACC=CAM_ASM_000861 /TAXON_ID=933848 /ORGANISM="Elphidium margaritaceum" /LENGTH=377 /DNA_ID=CAMNT_0049345889 /DNA_START=75 /DNA_END=1208 /DNA_ORIENTATION=+